MQILSVEVELRFLKFQLTTSKCPLKKQKILFIFCLSIWGNLLCEISLNPSFSWSSIKSFSISSHELSFGFPLRIWPSFQCQIKAKVADYHFHSKYTILTDETPSTDSDSPHCWWHGASMSTSLASTPASAESSYFCAVYFCCKAKVIMLALFSYILHSVNCVFGHVRRLWIQISSILQFCFYFKN